MGPLLTVAFIFIVSAVLILAFVAFSICQTKQSGNELFPIDEEATKDLKTWYDNE